MSETRKSFNPDDLKPYFKKFNYDPGTYNFAHSFCYTGLFAFFVDELSHYDARIYRIIDQKPEELEKKLELAKSKKIKIIEKAKIEVADEIQAAWKLIIPPEKLWNCSLTPKELYINFDQSPFTILDVPFFNKSLKATLREKVNAKIQQLTPDKKMDDELFEISAFFDESDHFLNGTLTLSNVKHTYDEIPHIQLLQPTKLDENPIVQVDQQYCAFEKFELVNYFRSLQNILNKKNREIKIGCILQAIGHTLYLGIAHKDTPSWSIISNVHFPTQYIKLDEVAFEIRKGISNEGPHSIFLASFFVLKNDLSHATQIFQEWKADSSWEKITPEEISYKKAQLSDSNGRGLLSQSVRSKDLPFTKRLLELGADPSKINGVNSRPPLTFALWNQDIKTVELLLEAKANPNHIDDNGWTLLHVAAFINNVSTIKLLLKYGANINQRTKQLKQTSLYSALLNKKFSAFYALLDAGAYHSYLSLNNAGVSPLIIASENGYEEVVDRLIQKKANLNIQMNNQLSALYLAAQNGHTGVVKKLVQAHADVNVAYQNTTPLMIAISNNKEEIAHFLIEAKTDINLLDGDKESALHRAATLGKLSLVSALIEAKANLNGLNINKCTPLTKAIINNHIDVAKKLIKANADPNISPSFYTAAQKGLVELIPLLLESKADVNQYFGPTSTIYAAAESGQVEVVKELIKHKAFISVLATHNGATPLYIAAEHGNLDICRLLLQEKADVNIKYSKKITALYIAVEKNHPKVVELLLKEGADPDIPGDDEQTPLFIALKNKAYDIAHALLKAKADPNVGTKDKEFPIHQAVIQNQTDLIKNLLEYKADPHIRFNDGKSILNYAIEKAQTENITLFEKHQVSYIPPSQQFIIAPSKKISLPSNEGGICYGGAGAAMLLFLRGLLPQLTSHSEKIASISSADFKQTIDHAYKKRKEMIETIKPDICKDMKEKYGLRLDPIKFWDSNTNMVFSDRLTNQETRLLNDQIKKMVREHFNKKLDEMQKEEAVLFDIVELLEKIEIIFQPNKYNDLFVKKTAPENQNLSACLSLFSPEETKDSIVPIHAFPEFFYRQDFLKMFSSLEATIKLVVKDRPFKFALFIIGAGHAILVGFDSGKKLNWVLVDFNQLPPKDFNHRELSTEVLKGLLIKKNISDTDCVVGFIETFALQSDSALAHTIIHKWQEHPDYQTFHPLVPSLEKSRAIDSKGRTLLYMAAKIGKTSLVKSLLHAGALVSQSPCPLLFIATQHNRSDIVILLIHAKADLEKSYGSQTPLFSASSHKYFNIAEYLIQKKANIDHRDNNGDTCLSIVTFTQNHQAIDFLLKHKANPNIVDNNNLSCLRTAVEKNDAKSVNLLLEGKADVNLRSTDGSTVLHYTVDNKNFLLTKLLLPHARVNQQMNNKKTALYIAAMKGLTDVVEMLIEAKAYLSYLARDNDGLTPLMVAAQDGHVSTIKLLLDKKAHPDIMDGLKKTALHHAVIEQKIEVVKILLDAKACPNHFDQFGRTSFAIAVSLENKEIIQCLIDAKANINEKDENGITTLYHAIDKYTTFHDSIALLKYGADPTILPPTGLSPLHISAKKGRYNILELLEAKADLHLKTPSGETALELAVLNNFPSIVETLLEQKADAHFLMKNGKTLVDFALNNNHLSCFQYLLEHGAPISPSSLSDCNTLITAQAMNLSSYHKHIYQIIEYQGDTEHPVLREITEFRTELQKKLDFSQMKRFDLWVKDKKCDDKNQVSITPFEMATIIGDKEVIDLIVLVNECRPCFYRYHALLYYCENSDTIATFKKMDQLAQVIIKKDIFKEHVVDIQQIYLEIGEGTEIGLIIEKLKKLDENIQQKRTAYHHYSLWHTHNETDIDGVDVENRVTAQVSAL